MVKEGSKDPKTVYFLTHMNLDDIKKFEKVLLPKLSLWMIPNSKFDLQNYFNVIMEGINRP